MLRCFCPLQIYSLLYKLSVDLYSKDNIGENIQSEYAFDVYFTKILTILTFLFYFWCMMCYNVKCNKMQARL